MRIGMRRFRSVGRVGGVVGVRRVYGERESESRRMSSGGVAGEARIGREDEGKRTEAVLARGSRKDSVDCVLVDQR